MQIKPIRGRTAALGLIASAGLIAGCQSEPDQVAPREAAQEALHVKNSEGTRRTVEAKRTVDVIDERKVVDAQTGEVLSDTKKVTPVTVEKTKEIQTHVQEGKPVQSPK